MEYRFESFMRDTYDVTGFPTAKVNRVVTWIERDFALEQELDQVKGLGLAIKPSLEGSVMDLTVEIGMDAPYQDIKLVVYLQENGMVYPQVNYYNNDASSSAYGLGNPIEDFVHNHILRSALTDVFGDAISNTEIQPGEIYSRSFEVDLEALNINENNMSAFEWVAFVMDEDDRVINVQHSAFDQGQDFD